MAVRDEKHINQGSNRNVTFTLKVLVVVLTFSETNVLATHQCTKSQFWVHHADGTTSCEDCPTCPPGQGLSHECGTKISARAMVNCMPCKNGISYSASDDTTSCRPCSAPCSVDQVVDQACTPTTDVKCAKRCKSKERYYDDVDGCKFCSKCCGHKHEVKNECKEKRGTTSANMICSFHSNASQCGSTTTASLLAVAATTVLSTLSSPLSTTAAVYLINNESAVLQSVTTDNSTKNSITPLVAVPTALGLVLVVAVGIILYLCYPRFKRKCSCLKDQDVLDLETGISGDSGDGSQQTYGVQSDEVGEARKTLTKRKVEIIPLEALSPSDSSAPLLQKESCQGDEKTAPPKLLCSLLEDNDALKRVCVYMDASIPGCGNYKELAKYYRFHHCAIKSVLETYDGGPTMALIEYLASSDPDLTIAEFARIVEKTTKRKDVIKQLEEYNSS